MNTHHKEMVSTAFRLVISRSLLLSVMMIVGLVLPSYSQTPQEKAAALAAVAAEWDSLPHVDLAADSLVLLDFVKSRAEFSDSGIVAGSTCVWARFNDGRTLVIANNIVEPAPPDPPPAVESSSVEPHASEAPRLSKVARNVAIAADATATELPTSLQARLIHTISGWATAVPNIRPWLRDAGYTVIDDPGTVASLRNVQGDGVLYMEAHGAVVVLSEPVGVTSYAVWTADTLDLFAEGTDPLLSDDLNNGRVLYMMANENVDPITNKAQIGLHYAITSNFVHKYWSFTQNSFVFLTVCDSFNAGSASFRDEVLAKGASVYAGWTGAVGVKVGVRSARLVLDRMLGANKESDPDIQEANFEQRPFDYVSIMQDLPKHNLGKYQSESLLFTPTFIQSFGLLAPSIVTASTIETDIAPPYTAGTLQIDGMFGADPRPDPDSKVTVGGLECPIKPGADGWQQTQGLILCDLPSGAAGGITVTVRKHDSNKGQLTKWNGTFSYSIYGDDSLKVSVNYNAVFRGDARMFRAVIHDPPIGPFLAITGLIPDESSASYSCSGSATHSEPGLTVTITWTGGGNMSASRVAPPGPNSFQFSLAASTPTVKFGSYYGPGPGCDWTTVTVTDTGTYTDTGHWDLLWPGLVDIGALPIEPNDPSFPAGSMNFAFCQSPPTLTSNTQCKIQWDTITATFPPDATSAR